MRRVRQKGKSNDPKERSIQYSLWIICSARKTCSKADRKDSCKKGRTGQKVQEILNLFFFIFFLMTAVKHIHL
jgi:hypothetical protein